VIERMNVEHILSVFKTDFFVKFSKHFHSLLTFFNSFESSGLQEDHQLLPS